MVRCGLRSRACQAGLHRAGVSAEGRVALWKSSRPGCRLTEPLRDI